MTGNYFKQGSITHKGELSAQGVTSSKFSDEFSIIETLGVLNYSTKVSQAETHF